MDNQNHLAAAQQELNRLRQPGFDFISDYGGAKGSFYSHLNAGALTLEDVGTNEEEMSGFEKLRFVAYGKWWLASLREGKAPDPNYLISLIRRELKGGKFTLEDIGTTEEELASFCSGS